jgi:hypothetical protein
MITYMGVLSMGSAGMILYVPLILTGFLETADSAKAFIDRNPSLPLVGMMKDTFNKGV